MVGTVMAWALGIVVLAFFVFNLWAGRVWASLPLLILALVALPPVRHAFEAQIDRTFSAWLYSLVGFGLVVAYVLVLFWSAFLTGQIFNNDEARTAMMEIYDERLDQWPTAYEIRIVDTSYGDVYVIVSGPEDAPPAFLFHASAMSSWSWQYNVGALNQRYRTYAVDLIGEANRTVPDDANRIPRGEAELADFYAEIADKLGIDRSVVVGASMGGFVATNYALRHPERVERLVLLGPMGMTPATGRTALRIVFAQLFPVGPVVDNTVRWVLGDDEFTLAQGEEWLRYVMTDASPRPPSPRAFKPEELQRLPMPVLLVIGSRDNLTGDPERVRELAENTPDIEIHVLDSGHMIGIEKRDEVNDFMLAFL